MKIIFKGKEIELNDQRITYVNGVAVYVLRDDDVDKPNLIFLTINTKDFEQHIACANSIDVGFQNDVTRFENHRHYEYMQGDDVIRATYVVYSKVFV